VVTVATGALPHVTGTTSPALSSTQTPAYTYATVSGRAGYRARPSIQTINRWKSGVTWNGAVSLTHDTASGGRLEGSTDWSQAYSKYRDTTGSWYSDMTMQRTGLNVTFSNVGAVWPTYTITDSAGAAVDLRDMSKFSVTQARSRPQTGVDTRNGASLDYKQPLDTRIPVTLKVGSRLDVTTRNIDNRVFNRTGTSTTTGYGGTYALTGSALAALVDDGFSTHPIGYGLPAFNFISLYKAYNALGGAGYVPYTPASDTIARFDDETKAAYGRVDVKPAPNFLIVAGARFEDRSTDIENRLSTLPSIVKAKFSNSGWFPSLNLKYNISPNLVARFGAAKSIGLPDYSDLLPGAPTVTEPTSTDARQSRDLQPEPEALRCRELRHGRRILLQPQRVRLGLDLPQVAEELHHLLDADADPGGRRRARHRLGLAGRRVRPVRRDVQLQRAGSRPIQRHRVGLCAEFLVPAEALQHDRPAGQRDVPQRRPDQDERGVQQQRRGSEPQRRDPRPDQQQPAGRRGEKGHKCHAQLQRRQLRLQRDLELHGPSAEGHLAQDGALLKRLAGGELVFQRVHLSGPARVD
jgi:hypothetical protein